MQGPRQLGGYAPVTEAQYTQHMERLCAAAGTTPPSSPRGGRARARASPCRALQLARGENARGGLSPATASCGAARLVLRVWGVLPSNLVLGSWAGARRPFHLFLFLTASRVVFYPKILVLTLAWTLQVPEAAHGADAQRHPHLAHHDVRPPPSLLLPLYPTGARWRGACQSTPEAEVVLVLPHVCFWMIGRTFWKVFSHSHQGL